MFQFHNQVTPDENRREFLPSPRGRHIPIPPHPLPFEAMGLSFSGLELFVYAKAD